MHLSDLVFTGFNKRVAAVHRDSGQLLWQWKAPQSGYVTLLLDGDRLIVSVNGYLHALEALTGRHLWSNDLPGFGTGVASLASTRGGSSDPITAFASSSEAQQAAMTQQQSSPMS
ncbi:MAG: PQQ-binding-like beta-propeller repeat protein [Verrucomicrobiaceae bacterium]